MCLCVCVCFWFAGRWFHFKMICKVHSLVRIHFIVFRLPREYNFTILVFFIKMAANIFLFLWKICTNIWIFTLVFCRVCINMNIFDIFLFSFLTEDPDDSVKSVTYLIVCVCVSVLVSCKLIQKGFAIFIYSLLHWLSYNIEYKIHQ